MAKHIKKGLTEIKKRAACGVATEYDGLTVSKCGSL